MSTIETMDFDDDQKPESFETAKPITRPVRVPSAMPTREPPHSQEAEEHVIAVCLLDGDALDASGNPTWPTLTRCIDAGLLPSSFYLHQNRLLFSTAIEIRLRGTLLGLDTLAEELKTRKQLDAAGGIGRLIDITSKTPTTTHAGYFIAKVRELADRRAIISNATSVVEAAYNGEDNQRLRDLVSCITPEEGRESVPAKSITSFAYPSDDDPNMLLGSEDYLGRGGGLLFVSHAGAGKSSWAMDACMMWSLGRVWMQIKSHKPRKCLIIQAEDSDRYIGKIFESFVHANKLTRDEMDLLSRNCVIVRLKGVSGDSFFAELKRLTTEHQPDLVIINPLYLYADGDITRSEFAQPFLINLDAVNKAEKFAYILIHHTGKPAAKQNGKRAEVEDWESAYMGFGSSYLANWPRATILLEPVAGAMGRYTIKLGKGGLNAGVTKEVDQGAGVRHEPTTRIAIRHSTDRMMVGGKERRVYYWETDDTPSDESGSQSEASKPKRGRQELYPFSTYRSIFPAANAQPIKLGELHRFAIQNKPIDVKVLYNVLERYVDSGFIECVESQGQPKKYRLAL